MNWETISSLKGPVVAEFLRSEKNRFMEKKFKLCFLSEKLDVEGILENLKLATGLNNSK